MFKSKLTFWIVCWRKKTPPEDVILVSWEIVTAFFIFLFNILWTEQLIINQWIVRCGPVDDWLFINLTKQIIDKLCHRYIRYVSGGNRPPSWSKEHSTISSQPHSACRSTFLLHVGNARQAHLKHVITASFVLRGGKKKQARVHRVALRASELTQPLRCVPNVSWTHIQHINRVLSRVQAELLLLWSLRGRRRRRRSSKRQPASQAGAISRINVHSEE